MNTITLLILLLAAGMLLIGAEVFVPGAVLGTLGGMALFGAVIVAFTISLHWGFITAFGVLILAVVSLAIWIKFFPRTSIGRKMTLEVNGSDFKTSDSKEGLLHQTGTAQSELRPAGFAQIGGHRVDVIAEGGVIDRGTPVQVIKVEGSRVVVRRVES